MWYRYLTGGWAGEDENKGVWPLIEVQQPLDPWYRYLRGGEAGEDEN
jgi:hypothetical protein